MSNTGVAPTSQTNLPAYLKGKGDEQNYRMEDDNDIVSPPRLKILQPTSEEVAIHDLGKAGQFWFGAQRKVLSEPVIVCPILARKHWAKFEGKKFVWSTNDPKDSRIAEEGDEAYKTKQLVMMVAGPMGVKDVAIDAQIWTFSGTSFKKGRSWYNQAFVGIEAAPFSQKYEITTTKHTGEDGVWFTPEIRFVGYVTEKEYAVHEEIYRKFVDTEISPDKEDDLPF